LAALVVTQSAAAFCPSRTCRPKLEACEIRGEDCVVSGVPLFRNAPCVTFNVQEAGSTRHGLSAAEFEGLVSQAFERWLSVDCGGGAAPSLEVESLGSAECHEVQYNCTHGNANIFMFNDELWTIPGAADAFALTTVFFSPSSGEIRDVDVEINGTMEGIEWSGPEDGVDLGSILTHEVGHFLGLGHSPDEAQAVMRPRYRPGVDDLRELTPDDMAGICATYPPERATSGDCTPRNGFATDCGPGDGNHCTIVTEGKGCCSTAPGRASDESALATALGCALVSVASWRRRARINRPRKAEAPS
jgi:hypothetical protein